MVCTERTVFLLAITIYIIEGRFTGVSSHSLRIMLRSAHPAIRTLEAMPEGSTELHCACWADDMVDSLLSIGHCSVSVKNEFGRPPLHWTSWNGNLETTTALLDNGADVSRKYLFDLIK
jgi:hypothetical protein